MGSWLPYAWALAYKRRFHRPWIGYIAAAVPLVPEPVPAIGPANDGVGALADEPVMEPLRAANR